jgi:hypothetical protein
MEHDRDVESRRAGYARLLRLYPRSFRERYAEPMEQTFADSYADRRAAGRPVGALLAGTYLDTSIGILKENLMNDVRRLSSRPWLAALLALLFVVPFLVTNFIVVYRLEPFFSLLRPGPHTGPFEYLVLAIVLLLVLAGAFVALAPLRRGTDGKRRFPPLNIAVAALLIAGFLLVAVNLGQEIYACDIAGIPNCD